MLESRRMKGLEEVGSFTREPANDAAARTVDAILLERLYRSHGRRILRRASAIMGDRDAGKDVMQEAFLRAFGARADFTSSASSLGWLHRITTNICLNRLRDARRRGEILGRLSPPSAAVGGDVNDTALTARALLGSVPASLQEIAICYFVDRMSQNEIATLLEIPRRTIGYRLEQFRAMALAAIDERAAS